MDILKETPTHTIKEIIFSKAINMKYSGPKHFCINYCLEQKNSIDFESKNTSNHKNFELNEFNRESIVRWVNSNYTEYKEIFYCGLLLNEVVTLYTAKI